MSKEKGASPTHQMANSNTETTKQEGDAVSKNRSWEDLKKKREREAWAYVYTRKRKEENVRKKWPIYFGLGEKNSSLESNV